MAASNTDKFKKARRRFSTTIGTGGFAQGATTLPLASTAGLDTDTAITLVIDAGTGNEEVVTGVVSGTNIINCLRGREGTTDTAHSAGEDVTMYFTETHWDDLVDGILASHDQDGTLKSGAVDATAVIADGIVTAGKLATDAVETAKIKDLNVTTSKLAANAVTYAKVDYSTLPSAIMTFSTYGNTGGQVLSAGTSYIAFDTFETNNQTIITKQANGVMKVSDAGFYFATFNYSCADVTSSNTSSIFTSTDNVNYYQVTPWTVNQSVAVNRGFNSNGAFYLAANSYVKCAIDVSTQTRIASWNSVSQKYMTSFMLMRIG